MRHPRRPRPSLRLAALVGATVLAVSAGCQRGLAPGAAVRTEAGVDAAARAGRWWAVQLHAHSTYSDGKLGVAAMIAKAKAAGLDALAISDHETTSHWLDPAFVAEKDLLLIRALEGADEQGRNHVGIHGLSGITPIPPIGSRDTVLAQAAARGATVIMNHPFNRLIPWTPLALDPRVHAIEVWNSWYWTPLRTPEQDEPAAREARLQNDQAIAWWVRLLAAGERVAPIAAADFHQAPQRLDAPCTLVWAAARTQDAILAGIRDGRTVLVNGPREARLELLADADGDGRFEAMVGDTTRKSARFKLRVTGGRGLTLKLLRGEEVRLSREVPTDDFTTEVAGAGGLGAPFVFARLDGLFSTPRAMTSAIYLR